MAKGKEQFLAIAQVCAALSVSAPTVEQRDTFLDFARKWQKMADEADALAPLTDETPLHTQQRLRQSGPRTEALRPLRCFGPPGVPFGGQMLILEVLSGG